MKKLMTYAIAAILMFSGCAEAGTAIEKVPGSYWTLNYDKFAVDGHEYIHFTNPWYGRNDLIIHDPDCQTCDDKVSLEAILDEIKKTAPIQANFHDMDIFFQEIKQTILSVQSNVTIDNGDKKKDKKKKH